MARKSQVAQKAQSSSNTPAPAPAPAVVTPAPEKKAGGNMFKVRTEYKGKKWADDAVITVVNEAHLKACPKAEGSAAAKRFVLYKQGMTVAQHRDAYVKAGADEAFLKAYGKGPAMGKGLSLADLRWDSAKGYITIK